MVLPAPVGTGQLTEARTRQVAEHGRVSGGLVGDEPVDAAQAEPVGGLAEQPVLQSRAVLHGVDAQVADVRQTGGAGVVGQAVDEGGGQRAVGCRTRTSGG